MPFSYLPNDTSIPYANAGQIYAAAIIFPVLGSLITGLRFWARSRRGIGVKVDDWLVVPATIAMTGIGICLIIGAAKGVMGYPTPPPTVDKVNAQTTEVYKGQTLIQQLEYAIMALGVLAFGFTKLSILFLYRRIFITRSGTTWFSVVTWILIAFSTGWTIAFFFTQIFSCKGQPERYWGPLAAQAGHCVYGLAFLVTMAITDFVSDTIIFFLPLPLIWRLQMPLSRKLAATSILALGSLSLLGAGIKMSTLLGQLAAGYTKPVDLFLTISLTMYWTMIEAGVAIIAMNLPTLQFIFNSRTLQSMVHSVRSVISLRSLPQDSTANATNFHHDKTVLGRSSDSNHTADGDHLDDFPFPNKIGRASTTHSTINHAEGITITKDFSQHSLNENVV